jgi:asparagine synthase (glutamine-hydrolysing)
MCGIWARLGKKSEAFPSDTWIHTLVARGPEGTKVVDVTDNLILAFTRLAINGLSEAGMQPFNKSSITWMCNGEIYNARDIETSLKTEKAVSDCYCIGDLYLEHRFDLAAFARALDGVFAFVLYDKDLNRVVVGRDPYGVRPLFIGSRPKTTLLAGSPVPLFTYSNDTVIFASEIKAIMPYYEIVSPFPPGHVQVYDATTNAILFDIEYHTTPWITHPSFRASQHPSSLDSASEALRYALEESVRKRMLTERPCAALLSGGLDSSLIAALVQKNLKQLGLPSLQTFSIGFAGSSDLLHAKLVANHIGSNHTEIVMTPDDFFKAIPRVIAAIESCDTTTVRASVGNFLVAEQIRKRTDCKVVFNGDGSDELFGGYLYFYNAPSDAAFHSETGRLLKDLHYFDVLRSDRCISAHGLEARTPFLDKQFVSVVRSIDPAMLRPIRGVQTEKYILRHAFADGITLPREVLWRRKEAFSDGVSTPEKSWYEEIKERVEEIVPPNWLMKATLHYSNWLPVKTAEEYYYRSLFTMNYGLAAVRVVLPYRWMPKWCPETTDPSARTLASYADLA